MTTNFHTAAIINIVDTFCENIQEILQGGNNNGGANQKNTSSELKEIPGKGRVKENSGIFH